MSVVPNASRVHDEVTLAEASMDGIASKLVSRSIQGLPLNEPIQAAKLCRKAAATQIRNAFNKWIRPEGFVQVTEGANPDQQ